MMRWSKACVSFLFVLSLILVCEATAGDFVVEDFEGDPRYEVWIDQDMNALGTSVTPDPFKAEEGGAPGSVSASARIRGHLGVNVSPWAWARIELGLKARRQPRNLKKYKSIQFWVKGDGASYSVALNKQSLPNDQFSMLFQTSLRWTRVVLPLKEFKQLGWGKKVNRVFNDVRSIVFSPVNFDSDFDLSIDRVVLSEAEVKLEPQAYQTQGWIPWRGTQVKKRRGTALDVSHLLDAPAGKHGWLRQKGEDFIFEDGSPARFWGVNIVASANFPSKKQAREMAELLAQMGVNMTRHHHYDAPWTDMNIFGKTGRTTALNAEAMDRFDYFIAQLQKRGIYQYMDLLVHRKAYKADGVKVVSDVVNGWKIEGEFDDDLIALQKKFVSQFLNHKNPYTQKTYGQDPAFALMEIINEDSLFYMQKEGDFSVQSPYYRNILNTKFSVWLQKKYGKRSVLEDAWISDDAKRPGLKAEEELTKKNIHALVYFGDAEQNKVGTARAQDTLLFYYDTMKSYFKQIIAVVKKTGSGALIAGSNHWVAHPADLYLNSQLDYIDRHNYWDHASGGWSIDKVHHSNRPMVKDQGLGLIGDLAARRVAGKPYIVTEWQAGAPNDYRNDANLIMAAYAGLQNWSAIQFAFSHSREGLNTRGDKPMSSLFDVLEQPGQLALWPTSALMALRGDFQKSRRAAYKVMSPKEALHPDSQLIAPRRLGLISRTGIQFEAGPVQTKKNLKAALGVGSAGAWTVADTRQLRHHAAKGRFEMRAPRTQGFSGFYKDSVFRSPNLEIKPDNEFATLVLTSLDGKAISLSKHLLLSAVGKTVNTDMLRSYSGDSLVSAGVAPILMEPVNANIRLRGLVGSNKKFKIFPLDANGRRKKNIAVVAAGGGLRFRIEALLQAVHYEIIR